MSAIHPPSASSSRVLRPDGRPPDALRPVSIQRGYLRHAEGSVLITMGATRVVCSASVEDRVPPFLRGRGQGWVTAEYGMLPRSSDTRIQRDQGRGPNGRTHEIQRLVGRSLRAITDRTVLGDRTIYLDCDVIDADGGTRTAAITGAYVALHDALTFLREKGVIKSFPLKEAVAAVSVGVVDAEPLLDLCYEEDVRAEVDMNLVMTSGGQFVEVQGAAEGAPFTRPHLNAMLALGQKGIAELIARQQEALAVPLVR